MAGSVGESIKDESNSSKYASGRGCSSVSMSRRRSGSGIPGLQIIARPCGEALTSDQHGVQFGGYSGQFLPHQIEPTGAIDGNTRIHE